MSTKEYDLIVIGGGPAGYVGAIRAGQLGKKVLCIEGERAGGTCLNWGCIPTKALLKSAELYQAMLHAEDFGFSSQGGVKINFKKVIERSRVVSDNMAKGIEYLFEKNKVDYWVASAQVTAKGAVTIIAGKEKGASFSAPSILVCTGCKAKELPNVKVDGKQVMTSREALVIDKLPKSIVILGAGAIGAEFAYFFNALGSKVTLVEMLPHILPVEDDEVAKTLERLFKKQGIMVHAGTTAENIQVKARSVKLDLVKGGKKEACEAESLLVAIGLDANLNHVFSPQLKPALDRGYLKVDDKYETSVKGVYAAGDIIGPPWLAHVATFEAIQAVNGIFNHSKPERVTLFPGCTYCQPQVASIGLTERAVKERGVKYKVGKFPFSASGKAIAGNHPEGFVKLILDEKYGEILGAHIIGSDATELIAEYTLAMKVEATGEDIHHTIHAHPTLSEALAEAVADAYGEAIHI